MLTHDEILLILNRLQWEVVAEFDGYRVVREGMGYSDDDEICRLQGRLSIMLQVAAEREKAAS